MKAAVIHTAYHLPRSVLDNEALERDFPDLPARKILAKTGISERRISAGSECASDLAVQAAENLFECLPEARAQIDALLFCTQSPDYFLPTTACLIQNRLGLSNHIAAFDFNLGCSGFIYGLGIAKGMIETGQAKNVLLLTADTYSKFIHARDRSIRTLFGDGAAATLISGIDSSTEAIGPFVYGTDGSGSEHLMVKAGGLRTAVPEEPVGDLPDSRHLQMNGPDIFNFTIKVVPDCIRRLEERFNIDSADIDLFVFHQANAFMLEHLRKKLGLPIEKFFIHMKDCGNTVSSTIPIALTEAKKSGALKQGMWVMLVGFGVGLSWGVTLIRWQ